MLNVGRHASNCAGFVTLKVVNLKLSTQNILPNSTMGQLSKGAVVVF